MIVDSEEETFFRLFPLKKFWNKFKSGYLVTGPDPIGMQETKLSVHKLLAVLQDKLLDVKHTAMVALNKLFPLHEG